MADAIIAEGSARESEARGLDRGEAVSECATQLLTVTCAMESIQYSMAHLIEEATNWVMNKGQALPPPPKWMEALSGMSVLLHREVVAANAVADEVSAIAASMRQSNASRMVGVGA